MRKSGAILAMAVGLAAQGAARRQVENYEINLDLPPTERYHLLINATNQKFNTTVRLKSK